MFKRDSKPFPPELRTASVVPRWSIVWTLTRDTVANHSFYVAFYARQIALLIDWCDSERIKHLDQLVYRALVDDLDETITGDIVSPVKAQIVDDRKAESYIADKMVERLPTVMNTLSIMDSGTPEPIRDEMRRIIKAADRLDAVIFLTIEKRLGNSVIVSRIPSVLAKLKDAWLALPADVGWLEQLWVREVIPAIRDHETTGGYGV